MRKSIFTLLFALSAALQVNAQDHQANISDLIAAKRFAFVVTKMQTKPLYVTAYDSYSSPSVAPSQMNLSLLAQTQLAGGKGTNYDQNNYVSQINVDHNYYNAYGIDKYPKNKDQYNTQEGQSVFFIQLPDGMLVSGDRIPTDLRDLNGNDFYAYQAKDITNAVKSSKGKYQITYSIGKGKENRKFEIEVAENGEAVLKTAPLGNNRQYMYGYIVDSQSLQFNKEQ